MNMEREGEILLLAKEAVLFFKTLRGRIWRSLEGGIMTSVGEDFPQQQERVRHLIDEYRALPGGVGEVGAIIMDAILKRAADSQSSGDLVRILQSYQELVGCE